MNSEQYLNQTTVQDISFATLNIPLCFTAFLGNILIISALKRVLSLRPPSKLLLRCLAVTDLCVGLITQPDYVVMLLSPEDTMHFYYALIFYLTAGFFFCLVSLLTVTSIGVDRLLVLLLEVRYTQVVTLTRVRVVIVSIWLSCALIPVTVFFGDAVIPTGIICMVTLLCIITSTFCYSKIYLKLRHRQTQVHEIHRTEENRGAEKRLGIARYRRTVSSAIWVQMVLLACYLPFVVVIVVIVITRKHTSSLNLAFHLTQSLALFNSTLNPFLYCWKIREVRRAAKSTIRQYCAFTW